MKDQLQTIREAWETLLTNLDHAVTAGAWRVAEGSQTWDAVQEAKQALTALSEIERMAGEPFAHFVYFPDQQRGEFVHDLDELCEDMTNDENHEVTPLYATPPAQQPQAEAVHELCPSCRNGDIYACTCTFPRTNPEAAPGLAEFFADLNRSRAKYPNNARMWDGLMGEVDELRRAYQGDGDQRAEAFDVAVCAYRIATEGDAGGNTLLAAPQQAEAVPVLFDPQHMLAVFDKARHGSTGPAGFARGITAVIAEWEAGREQAEVVPPDVVRDAERYQHLRNNAARQWRNGPGLYWYLPRGLSGDAGERLDAAIDAAIAAQGEKP